jgi:hypothetical protein
VCDHRCFTACVCTSEGQQSWTPTFADDEFIAKLAWILRSALNELLMQRSAELLYALLYVGKGLTAKLVWEHDVLAVIGAQLVQPEVAARVPSLSLPLHCDMMAHALGTERACVQERITEKIAHLLWEVVELLLSRPGLATQHEDSAAAEERVMRKLAGTSLLSLRCETRESG